MNARSFGWLVFLALIHNFSCNSRSSPFSLEDKLTAKEGTCTEIKCTVNRDVTVHDAYWFWMKDPKYIDPARGFNATIIYSTNKSVRPVSPDFAKRVKYIGSPSESWGNAYSSSPRPRCSILICDLNKSDSGNYSFRFVGKPEAGKDNKWVPKKEATLTVEDNPCLITFKEPTNVIENNTINLECSTLSSCRSSPKIEDLTQQPSKPGVDSQTSKNTKYSLKATWKDDGRVFSCLLQENVEGYSIRNISLTVEYAPKDTVASINEKEDVKEGESVTLTCSAKGRPNLNFSWFKDDHQQFSGANWTIASIQDSQSGFYYCESQNIHGIGRSNRVHIKVTYAPDVDIQVSQEPKGGLKEGDSITLTCNVNRSKPDPDTFIWYKDGAPVGDHQTYVVERLKPEDRGVYECAASNSVGFGSRKSYPLKVLYRPRHTSISINGANNHVKVNSLLTFTCNTDAYPDPWTYSWYRYNKTGSSQWTPMIEGKRLTFSKVQRADEACYICNTTNSIGTGKMSEPMCIHVLFPPTKTTLTMDTVVIEGQSTTITCTAESSPPSRFTLWSPLSNPWSSKSKEYQLSNDQNTFRHTFTANSTHAGSYTCEARNSEGSKKTMQRKLVVKYAPKEVKVKANPGPVVTENRSFTLSCSADSYPQVTAVTWMKMTNGNEHTLTTQRTFSVKSASPSDSGWYSCTARNDIGTRKSQQFEVEVEYGPKYATIIKGPEQQRPDGKRFVVLSCSSHCYPPDIQYSWYKKAEKGDVKQFSHQNFTVDSDQRGEYYCVAKNKLSQKSSDTIRVFDDRVTKALKLFFLVCLILLVLFFILFGYRRWRNKSIHQGTTNTRPCCGFLGWCNGARRRNRVNETRLVEPSRSRDDLLPNQPRRPKPRRCQPRPDSTPESNIHSVYVTVNLPQGTQAPSAQKPTRQHGGHMEDASLNYASLHFGKQQRKPGNQSRKPEEDVYTKVSKPKPSKEKEQQRPDDYENINTVHAAKLPNPCDYDSDTSTSEDEVEVNYSQVNFKPKVGHQRANRRSSSSEDETQYSEVKT